MSRVSLPPVSAPAAQLPAERPRGHRTLTGRALWEQLGAGRFYLTLATMAVTVAALSLLIPSTPSYDPWSWLMWGREIVHLDLQTTGGPSWKPLPVIFTTIFAPLGHAAPDLWLVVARAGAVMAVAMVFRLAYRLTRELGGLIAARESSPDATARPARLASALPSLLAGVIAAGSLVNSRDFITNNALGYSEGLAVALVLIAIDRGLDGARRQAFAIGFLAALDRPELWFFWGAYGLYLWWREPGSRRLVIGLFLLIPVLWFLPELWGSGQLWRGVTRAQHPRSNSAAFTSCPVCTVFKQEAWPSLLNRVKVAAIIAMLVAVRSLWRTRASGWRRTSLTGPILAKVAVAGLGLGGFAWWIGIAVETQGGFSGNRRYLVLGTACLAIAGGVAWGWLARAAAALLRRRTVHVLTVPLGVAVAIGLFLAVPPWIARDVVSLPRTHRALVYQAHLREDLAAAIHQSGGAAALLRCGAVMTEGYQVPMVAYQLGVHTLRIEAPPPKIVGPPWPNVILQTRAQSNATLLPLAPQILDWEHEGAHYTLVAHIRTFRVFSTCSGTAVS
jgi:hypothetical protein